MLSYNAIVDGIKKLSQNDRDKIAYMLNNASFSSDHDIYEVAETSRFANGRFCPHCNSKAIKRNGHSKDGVQRYMCNDCKKTFNANSNTILSNTQKSLDTWKKFIECIMDGLSINVSASKCDISPRTAFRWRHKILDSLVKMENSVVLEGIVEADETFYPISYKGNHKKDGFIMPRRSHKRGGTCSLRGLSRDKVNIPCAMNRNGLSIGKVSSLGKSSLNTITNVFKDKIKENSVLCTDGEKSYIKFAKAETLSNIPIHTHKGSKGIYNIQHINNYHSQLRAFIEHFKGVSTKYMNNYIAWHNFVNIAPEGYKEKHSILLKYLFTDSNAIKCSDIAKREPLPLLT